MIDIAAPQEVATPVSHEPPPPVVILNLLSGMMTARAVQVAANLGIADLLQDGPQSVTALAEATGTHAPSLYRLLRALASLGLFSEVDAGIFAQTTLSTFLASDVHGSMRDMARMWGDSWRWRAWGDLAYSIQTGRPAFDHLHGKNLWEYFAEDDPAAGRLFSMAMTSFSEGVTGPVVTAYDYSAFNTVVDIGGAHGGLIRAILRLNPAVRGILFDLPPVIEGARDRIAEDGLTDRCALVAGDFFAEVPAGADAYMMKFILHDWDDDHCVQILRNCRRAIVPTGLVLVVDQVLAPGNAPSFGKILDLEMLTILTGRERTEAEFAALFQAGGFRLTRVVPTASPLSIIEGVPD
jgi:hypothetical protein